MVLHAVTNYIQTNHWPSVWSFSGRRKKQHSV